MPEEGFGDAGFGVVELVVDAHRGGPESFGVGATGRVNGGVAPGDDGVEEFDEAREEDGFLVRALGVNVEEFVAGRFPEGVFETAAGENGDGFFVAEGLEEGVEDHGPGSRGPRRSATSYPSIPKPPTRP